MCSNGSALAALAVLGAVAIPAASSSPLAPATCGFSGAQLDQCQLQDGNSATVVDPTSNGIRGANNWQVDDILHLFQEWFWFRVGSNTAGNPDRSIDNLPLLSSVVFDNDADGAYETYSVQYGQTTGGFTISGLFQLTGGLNGSNSSQLGETVSVQNTGTEPLDMHLILYSDFDMNNSSADDVVAMPDISTFLQSDAVGPSFSRSTLGTAPNRWELACFPQTIANLDDANSTGNGYDLSSTPPIGTSVGPCDATWAAQYDLSGPNVLPPGGVATIGIDKDIIGEAEPPPPIVEPGSLTLLGFGLLALGLYRRGSAAFSLR